MSKAFFARKAINVNELKGITAQECGKSEFVIEKIIELPIDKWEYFKENLLDDFDFISNNIELMFIDINRVWHVLLVKAEDSVESILVEAEGYEWARYSSYIPDCTELIADYSKYNISDEVVRQILEIRSGAKFNMFSLIDIQQEALEKGFIELAILIAENPKEYSRFILTGQR